MSGKSKSESKSKSKSDTRQLKIKDINGYVTSSFANSRVPAELKKEAKKETQKEVTIATGVIATLSGGLYMAIFYTAAFFTLVLGLAVALVLTGIGFGIRKRYDSIQAGLYHEVVKDIGDSLASEEDRLRSSIEYDRSSLANYMILEKDRRSEYDRNRLHKSMTPYNPMWDDNIKNLHSKLQGQVNELDALKVKMQSLK